MLQRIITISFLLCIIYPLSCIAVEPESRLKVTDAWARASIPGATSSAAYMRIENPTDTDVTIIGAYSDIAYNNKLHDSYVDENGIMRMRELDVVVVPAKGEIIFAPLGGNDTTNSTSGIHIMLMRLKRQLYVGDKIMVELKIKDHKPKAIEVEVR